MSQREEQELVRLLLERSATSEAELERRLADPAFAADARKLSDLLERCRGALADVEPEDQRAAARAAERALARTAAGRVGSRSRGEQFRNFRRRLRAACVRSRALRFAAAASLLAHVIALPVAAWLIWRAEPGPRYQVEIELPREAALDLAPPREPPRVVEMPRTDALGEEADLADALARERELWTRFGAPAADLEAAEPEIAADRVVDVELVLTWRARVIAGAALPAWAQDRERYERAGDLVASLWFELLMDGYVASGVAPDLPDSIGRCIERMRTAVGAGDGGELCRLALERAERLGLVSGSGVRSRSAYPLDRAWLDALGRTWGQVGEGSVLERWLAFEPVGR